MAQDYDDMRMASRPIDADLEERDLGNRDARSDDWRDDDDRHEYRRVMSAATLAGDRVRNAAGEDLGKIEEIMLDVPTGRVAYAVLSFGGFLGIGDKLFAIPWRALTLNERDHEFILDVDKQRLENAPGFNKDNWPDMASEEFGTRISGYWSVSSSPRVDRAGSGATFDRDRNPNL